MTLFSLSLWILLRGSSGAGPSSASRTGDPTQENDDNEEKSALSPSVCYWILLLLLLRCPGDTLTMMTTNVRPSVRPSVVCLFVFVFYYFSHVHDERRTTTTTIKEEEEEEEKNDSFLLVGCLRFVIVKWTRLDMPCRAVLFITREIQ